jgi:adenylate cyclase
MPLLQSIAAKIFGLAVILLLLTIGLAGYLLWEAAGMEREIKVVAQLDVPLTESVSRIHEFGLRRRLAFERWFGALNAAKPNQAVVSEASTNYKLFTEKITAEFATARGMIDSFPKSLQDRPALVEVRTLLEQIEPQYPVITTRQREVLDLQLAGQGEKANELLNYLNDLQRTVQSQRELLQTKMAALSAASSTAVHQRQRRVLWLTVAATASTVLLGLVVATLITNRLTQPVRLLVTAIRDVQKGNLEVELSVRSRDEVGVLTDSFNYFVQELRSKEQLRRTFGKYIDPRVLEHVLSQSGMANESGGRRVMTVLFADLVGSTGLYERLTPSLMVNLLNRHFGLQAQVVQEHRGIVDKFIGDSVMAFWGPPFVQAEEHSVLACRAALGQLAALDVLRRELPEITGLRKDAPSIDLRIGVCTGDVVVGNIGSENTRSYTVIGDTVNLSDRLQGANRIYGTRILISESTAEASDGQFETREIDVISVKGKTETTRIFELLGAKGHVGEDVLRLRDHYAQALRAYRAQDWDRAEVAFRECLDLRPQDGPSPVFLDRIRTSRRATLDKQWNGVWQLTEK